MLIISKKKMPYICLNPQQGVSCQLTKLMLLTYFKPDIHNVVGFYLISLSKCVCLRFDIYY